MNCNFHSTRRLVLVALVAGLASQTACENKPEGILLVIRTPNQLPGGAELEVFAGSLVPVRHALGISNPTVLHNELIDADTVAIEAIDSPAETILYFIEASASRGFLDVAVRLKNYGPGGDWVGYLPNLALEAGVVREWEIPLVRALQVEEAFDCLIAEPEANDIVIVSMNTDYDCDGVAELDDCAPFDGRIAPGLPDICDFDESDSRGDVDNNCNGICGEDRNPDGDPANQCGSEEIAVDFLCPATGLGRDCEEENPFIYPGAPEICDGIFNRCSNDWNSHANEVTCFLQEGADCLVGMRLCDDNRIGAFGECLPLGDVVGDEFCQATMECVREPLEAPILECVYERLGIPEAQCELAYVVDPQMPEFSLCETAIEIEPPPDCDEILVLSGHVTSAFGVTIEGCQPSVALFDLIAQDGDRGSFDLLLTRFGTEENKNHRVRVTTRQVDTCPPVTTLCDSIVDFQ